MRICCPPNVKQPDTQYAAEKQMITGKKPKSAKIWIANKNFQNLEEILEMHSLIRLIQSAPHRGGRDISKKEYYYACVQDMGSRYINSSCLYVESATVLFLHNSVTHKTFVCYSAVQLLRDGSNVAAQWFLVVLMWHLRILAMA